MPKDFSHQDLRGKSFKNQDLTGADFSHADIRGVNFKGAKLIKANFAHAKGGVTKTSFAVYLLMMLVVSVLAGLLMALCNIWMLFVIKEVLKWFEMDTHVNIIIYTLLFFVFYVSTSITLIRKEKYNYWNISLITSASGFVTATLGSIAAATLVGAVGIAIAGSLAGYIFGLVALAGSVALAIAIFTAVGLTGYGGGAGAICVVIVVTVAGSGVLAEAVNEALILTGAGAGAGAILIQLILSVYIAYRTRKEDEQFDTYRKFGLSLSSLFGTNFDSANLTDTNFSKASLKYCRFAKETILLRTNFKNAENLKFARLTGTIMENRAVRELLISGNGKNQSFRGMNLKGAYLVGADLQNSDFHEADFIGATLEKANLKDANLSRIQALGVEFRGADLTGACLESWNIDATTQLDGAKADYVYLLGNQLERRPASGHFGEGEFAKLFNEVLDTVDFIFRNGIDWQAFMVSFDELREKIRIESEHDDISIQSITNKGDGVFVVKVNVPLHTDKPEFHNNFTKEYETKLKLIEVKYQAQLEFKEKEIAIYREKSIEFKEIIGTLAQKPIQNIIYNEPKAEASMGNYTTNIKGSVKGSTVVTGIRNVVKTKTDYRESGGRESDEKPDLKTLLTELRSVIEKSSEIEDKNKTKLLTKIKELETFSLNPNEAENKDKAGDILTWFGGMIPKLPMAVEAVEGISDLISAISGAFGVE